MEEGKDGAEIWKDEAGGVGGGGNLRVMNWKRGGATYLQWVVIGYNIKLVP